MMPNQPQNIDKELSQIRELITKNSSGIIVLPAKATPDAAAAGTSLYLALTKMGKNVSLVAAEKAQVDMVGADKIKTEFTTGGNNLVVSFPYTEGAIDKVDYNIQNERFNIVIIPREGQNKLDSKDIQYSYTGGAIDFIITIDAPNLNSLGDIYTKNQNTFQGKNIINIDRHLINNNYGTINLVAKSSSSTSEIVLKVIQGLKIELDRDIATNLHSGIMMATNNLGAYSVNADTYETVAALMRAGAVKKPMRPMGNPGAPNMGGMPMMPQFGGQQPRMGGNFGQPAPFPQMNPMPQGQNYNMNPQPMPMNQMPQNQQMPPQPQVMDNQRPLEDVEVDDMSDEGQESGNPENWLKPKIFSESGGLV
ncbi:MAG: bifunctional oligoribonuclease/PAP phosphatase NrnA [Weeksellaceae bacterium]